jgi:protein-tyrosine kinase
VSKIQEALSKLREQGGRPGGSGRSGKGSSRTLPDTVVPIASKKKVEIGGEKFPLDEEALIRRGLLAPIEHALPVADEFRRIKRPLIDNALRSKDPDAHMNLIVVAGAVPGIGKTFCAMNLAASMSLERETSVMLVDADVAKPHISSACGLADRPGLIDALLDDSLTLEEIIVRTDMNDVQILPAGQKHAQSTELLASDRMASVMHEIASRYPDRIIIMDSPPLLITSEAQAVARQAGQVALVVECGRTTNQQIQEALDVLDRDKAINVIFNKSVHGRGSGYYGGYNGDYGNYGFNTESDQA